MNNCGWEGHVKELYPDLFEKWSERYPSTPENRNPNAAADAYLKFGRGFDLAKIQGAYTQSSILTVTCASAAPRCASQ
ncbi:MAG: hypothetical protein WAN92_05190 [Herbaspirillum sp.]